MYIFIYLYELYLFRYISKIKNIETTCFCDDMNQSQASQTRNIHQLYKDHEI